MHGLIEMIPPFLLIQDEQEHHRIWTIGIPIGRGLEIGGCPSEAKGGAILTCNFQAGPIDPIDPAQGMW